MTITFEVFALNLATLWKKATGQRWQESYYQAHIFTAIANELKIQSKDDEELATELQLIRTVATDALNHPQITEKQKEILESFLGLFTAKAMDTTRASARR